MTFLSPIVPVSCYVTLTNEIYSDLPDFLVLSFHLVVLYYNYLSSVEEPATGFQPFIIFCDFEVFFHLLDLTFFWARIMF